MTPERKKKITNAGSIGNGLGFAVGIGYSFYKKTGFWKGFGYSLLFGIMGAGLSSAIAYATTKDIIEKTKTGSVPTSEKPQIIGGTEQSTSGGVNSQQT